MKNIIIDADTGADDALAIMLALNHKEFNILGITNVSGNAHVNLCAENSLNVLEFCDKKDVEVYIGEEKPLARDIEFTEEFCGHNGVCDYVFDKSSKAPSKTKAVSFICDMVKKHNNLSIVSTAPMTNIAKALEALNGNFNNLTIVTMAGYFHVNDYYRKSTEWNVFVDPEAYQYVVQSGVKIISLGADVTSMLTNDMVENILASSNSKYTDYLRHCSEFYLKNKLTPLSMLVDAVPVAYLIDDSIAKFYRGEIAVKIKEKISSDIITFRKIENGQHFVAYDIDTKLYLDILESRLF